MKTLHYYLAIVLTGLSFMTQANSQILNAKHPGRTGKEAKSLDGIFPVKDLLIGTFIQTKFAFAPEYLPAGQGKHSANDVPGFNTKGPMASEGDPFDAANENTLLKQRLWNDAIRQFEAYNFEDARKLFYRIWELNPADDYAKFYLALTQLYLGHYGPAANKLSVLNKKVSLENNPDQQLFKDEIKFYFAWSALKVSDSPKMALTLFTQLNYEGGKYQEVSKEMINLLRL